MSKHSFPLVESVKVVTLSGGRSIRITRDRTKENLKTNYGDGDIHLSCVAHAADPIELAKTLARLDAIRSIEFMEGDHGFIIHKNQ